MKEKELLEKINSKYAEEIFTELYGAAEIEAARSRYAKLVTGFPWAESGRLRVFSAPGRTELAGNHTDHNRGKVIAAAIQLDNIAIVQERGDNTVLFRSTGFPDVNVNLTKSAGEPDLQPKPEEKETTEALVRGIAAGFHRRDCSAGGFSANADSTVFPGSGLSSSAAVEMLLGRIFDCLYDEGKCSPLEIARIGQFAENAYFGKPCGLMDQVACATGGAVAINFADSDNPVVRQINFNPAAAGYALCVVNTGGSHADLTADYASIPAEMKAIAAFFGKSALGELDKETVLSNAAELRKRFGDRALLRSLHFFDENARVDIMAEALAKMENTASTTEKQQVLNLYLEMVNESGDSSWQLLQNVFSPAMPETQGISAALALTKDFFRKRKLHGACRVHGGGFAGTIQTYIPLDEMDMYRAVIEAVFGTGSVTPLKIRPRGAVELLF